MKTYQKAFTAILLSLLFLLHCFATHAQRSDRPVSEKEKNAIIAKVFSALESKYIFPEILPPVEKTINAKLANGGYAGFGTVEDFLKNLNSDLERLTNDRHVDVFFDPVEVKQINAMAADTSTRENIIDSQYLQRAKYENFMVRNVERLDGNVGYLKFNKFLDLQIAKPTLTAAMNLLTHSNALIIDLRQNGGGYSNSVDFLLSYFLADSTLTGHFTSRIGNSTRAMYTHYDPVIKKFPADISVYILTSKRTSSAAEAFAYTLQAFKRAMIIGDTTNGEANPGFQFVITDELYLMVPTFVNRNAITGTNWQGTGVIPDIKITGSKALIAAQAMAYRNLSQTAAVPEMKYFYQWMATGLEAEVNPVILATAQLKTFAGTYADNRMITLDNGILYYQRIGISDKKRMLTLTPDTFTPEGISFFRVQFLRDDKGYITALRGMYDDGKMEISKRIP
jgi:retinol-binding protein 3